MRIPWLSLPLLVVASLALLAAACNGDGGGPAASKDKDSGPADTGPSSSGAIVADTFLTFQGKQYELREVLQADLVNDEFAEIGVASDADIDYEGDLKVFRRSGDDASVYTFSAAVDVAAEEGDTPATWAKWEAAD